MMDDDKYFMYVGRWIPVTSRRELDRPEEREFIAKEARRLRSATYQTRVLYEDTQLQSGEISRSLSLWRKIRLDDIDLHAPDWLTYIRNTSVPVLINKRITDDKS